MKKEVVAELQFAHITIMFQDTEGFTTLSETMEPTQLAALTSECIFFILFILFLLLIMLFHCKMSFDKSQI